MGRVQGVRKGPPTPSPKMTSTFLKQLEFYKKNLCGLLVVKSNMRRPWRIYIKLGKNGSFLVVHPLFKKNPGKNPRATPVIII